MINTKSQWTIQRSSSWATNYLLHHPGAKDKTFTKYFPSWRSHLFWAMCTRKSRPQHLQSSGFIFDTISNQCNASPAITSNIISITRLMQSLFAATAFFYSPHLRWQDLRIQRNGIGFDFLWDLCFVPAYTGRLLSLLLLLSWEQLLSARWPSSRSWSLSSSWSMVIGMVIFTNTMVIIIMHGDGESPLVI